MKSINANLNDVHTYNNHTAPILRSIAFLKKYFDVEVCAGYKTILCYEHNNDCEPVFIFKTEIKDCKASMNIYGIKQTFEVKNHAELESQIQTIVKKCVVNPSNIDFEIID